MGVRLGFADVLLSKLADVPPPLVPGRQDARIASPNWSHRLEPLRVVPVAFFHSRYPSPASAAPTRGGIPVEDAKASPRSGSQVSSDCDAARPVHARHPRKRTQRERLGINLLNRLGADLPGTAADQEVRSAYRQLLRAAHPDMHPEANAAERERQARAVRAIVSAWDVFQGRASGLDA